MVIVGAGPGGSTAALVASKLGLRVLLIDRFQFPRIKPCGGGLTPKTLALMRGLDIDPEPIIRNRCFKVALTNWAGTYLLSNHYGDEALIGVTSREEFDNYLLNEALKHGVDFVKDRVTGIEETPSGVRVKGLSNEYLGSYVIGADGANSVVSRNIGNDRAGEALALMTIAHGGQHADDICLIDMTRIKWGYAWSFPRGRGEYDVGLGSLKWGNYREELRRYVKELSMSEGVIYGHPIPIKPRGRVVSKNVFLVGDAGGFADPTTGEGIFYAMYTGAWAALTIKKSKLTNPTLVYRDLVQPLIRNLRLAYGLSTTVYGLDTLVMSRYLGLTAFSYEGTRRLISRVMSGKSWYVDALKSLVKPSLHVRLLSNKRWF